ncbi:MAG: hypothetical protein JWP13_409 [Candidatus Saccharibacteria bacterium]|nr:hypothetical protein [Candidatus Saccharibacteria bacterium]
MVILSQESSGVPLPPHDEIRAQLAYDRMTNDHLAQQVVSQSVQIVGQQERIQGLELQATRNPVTHLYNEVGFNTRLDQIRETLPNTPIAIIEVDLGNFKLINDKLGHPVGDTVLRAVGAGFRESDAEMLVGHPHGDEFRVAAPLEARQNQELSDEERLQAMINRLKVVGEMLKAQIPQLAALGFSISAGGAILRPGMGLAEVIQEADKAMYRDKHEYKEAIFKSLPLRQRIAHHVGTTLLKYSRAQPSR